MRELAGTLVLVVLLLAATAYVLWAISDARRRGKSPLLVLIAVVFFFPFGLAVWLLFRPPASTRVPWAAIPNRTFGARSGK